MDKLIDDNKLNYDIMFQKIMMNVILHMNQNQL